MTTSDNRESFTEYDNHIIVKNFSKHLTPDYDIYGLKTAYGVTCMRFLKLLPL